MSCRFLFTIASPTCANEIGLTPSRFALELPLRADQRLLLEALLLSAESREDRSGDLSDEVGGGRCGAAPERSRPPHQECARAPRFCVRCGAVRAHHS